MVSKKLDVYGVEMTPIQEIVFMKWCSNNGVAMNTLDKSQRQEVAKMFLRNCKINNEK